MERPRPGKAGGLAAHLGDGVRLNDEGVFEAALRFLPSPVRLDPRTAPQAVRDILSEAGHDSYNIASVCPSAMIFTPCKDGITHNEAEDTTLEDTLPGCNVLLHAALARANR